ncbi:hypothetical protein WA538_005478, partial [Blastocystis sp. DL]
EENGEVGGEENGEVGGEENGDGNGEGNDNGNDKANDVINEVSHTPSKQQCKSPSKDIPANIPLQDDCVPASQDSDDSSPSQSLSTPSKRSIHALSQSPFPTPSKRPMPHSLSPSPNKRSRPLFSDAGKRTEDVPEDAKEIPNNTTKAPEDIKKASPVETKPSVFLLSSELPADTAIDTIRQLGGRCIQTHDAFAPGATHFIMATPKRTEKFLGAVACGLWVLRPEYLEASRNAGRWLPEEAFEWREVNKSSRIDGESIRRLRKEGGVVFKGARIVLVGRIVPSSEKWERIITAGGGKVAITSSRLSMETRALIEGDEGEGGLRLCVLPDHFPKNHLVEYATQWGYACVSSQYLLDLLSKE